MINIREKGAQGERQVAKSLNAVIQKVLAEHDWPESIVAACSTAIQRNQQQSAVGGSDLINVFGIGVEIKRQEQLSVNAWWKQCVAGAARNSEFPVLIYRKNHQPWSVVMFASLALPVRNETGSLNSQAARVTLEWDDFLVWFEQWVSIKLMNGEVPRV